MYLFIPVSFCEIAIVAFPRRNGIGEAVHTAPAHQSNPSMQKRGAFLDSIVVPGLQKIILDRLDTNGHQVTRGIVLL